MISDVANDNGTYFPPEWLREALEINKENESTQINSIGTSPPEENGKTDHLESCTEKNESKREGPGKRKKKANKKEKETAAQREESGICGGEGECTETTERLGVIQEEASNELDVRFRLLRDNYCALRHHYGLLRKKYQNLERKHGKCPSSRKKRDRVGFEREESEGGEVESASSEDEESAQEEEIDVGGEKVKNGKKRKKNPCVQTARKKQSAGKRCKCQEDEDEETNRVFVVML